MGQVRFEKVLRYKKKPAKTCAVFPQTKFLNDETDCMSSLKPALGLLFHL